MASRRTGSQAASSAAPMVTELFPQDEPEPDAEPGRMMYSLPSRFKAYSEADRGIVLLRDTATDKQVPVAITAWGEVRRVLGALFDGQPEDISSFLPPDVTPLPLQGKIQPTQKAAATVHVPATEPEPVPLPVPAPVPADAVRARGKAPAQEKASPPPVPAAKPPAKPQSARGEPVPPPNVRGAALKSWRAKNGLPAQPPRSAAASAPAAKQAKAADKPAEAKPAPAAAPPPPVIASTAEKPPAGKQPAKATAKAPEKAPALTKAAPVEAAVPARSAAKAADLAQLAPAVAEAVKPAQKPAAKAAKAKQPADGFEWSIDGLGYRLDYGRDPNTGHDAYRVTVEQQEVGWLRREEEKRWILYSTVDAFSESMHRNALGAQTRLETIYEPADA